MKKFLSLILSVILILSSFNISILNVFGASSSISQAYGWYEAIHLEWTNDTLSQNTSVAYKLKTDTQYTVIDSELIRSASTGCQADIVGIKAGIYDVKITTSSGEILIKNDISVASHDRSGYSHFEYNDGIGGYNNDGTPKDNAQIIYVDNSNKNTVKLGSYTGIGNILYNANKYSYPIIVRIIGTVDTQTRDADGTKTTDKNNGVIAINGLTDNEKSNDSYFNMLDVNSGKNITVEGIGNDASIEKWGFTFKSCNSIEVRNLTFTKYPEDACSFSGSSSKNSSYKNFWVHNNYFKKGENKYDLTDEQDKGDGDGSSDFSGCRNITYSYNMFENCHKTSLHGGSDSSLQYNSTWHHNYFINCGARLPLTRQVNLHTYNNYYYKCPTCTDARASAWVLSENNYFDSCTYAFKTTANSTYGDPIVKSLNNVMKNSSGTSDKASTIKVTTDRTLTISASAGTNTNKNPYPNFDTDSNVFYYDSSKKCSDVTYLTDAETAKSDALTSAGIMKENAILQAYLPSDSDTPTESTTLEPSVDSERFDKMELLIEQMREETDPTDGSLWNKENTSAFKWSYINGCMASAMMMLGNIKGDESYKTFADNYMSPFIGTSNSSTKGYIADNNFKISNYTLDDLNSGKALIELIASGSSNSSKYKNAVSSTLYSNVLQYILSNQTTSEGNLWHKKTYPYQVWLDGIYMETPFWLEYELEVANDSTSFINACDNVTKQLQNVYSKLRNNSTGLYYHGYDAQADSSSGSYNPSSAMSWAASGTGHSANYWLRGTGWYAMALVDNIAFIQKAEKKFSIDLSAQKNTLIDIYKDLMNSMLKYQDSDTKLWYQVIDKPEENYNYLETSGSAAMSYALMKGYNIGIADNSYYNKGLEVFRSLCDNKLLYTNNNSQVTLTDICMTAGLAGPSSGSTSSSATRGPGYKNRDGSYNYYISERTVENDAKGVAPLMFAYCQILDYNNNGGEIVTESTTSVMTTEITTETTTAYTSNVGETVIIGGTGNSVSMTPSSFASGTCNSNVSSSDGIFTLSANSSKTIKVSSDYIDLGGGGSVTSPRNIGVKVTGNAVLTIKYFNSGSADRTLAVESSDGTFKKTATAPQGGSTTNVSAINYTIASPDTYYIYSTSGGIKITEITVTYSNGTKVIIGDIDLNGTINKTDVSLLLKHISGISEISDEKQLAAADCNGDKKYDLSDVIAILKYL